MTSNPFGSTVLRHRVREYGEKFVEGTIKVQAWAYFDGSLKAARHAVHMRELGIHFPATCWACGDKLAEIATKSAISCAMVRVPRSRLVVRCRGDALALR
jgi:hypothetical protein